MRIIYNQPEWLQAAHHICSRCALTATVSFCQLLESQGHCTMFALVSWIISLRVWCAVLKHSLLHLLRGRAGQLYVPAPHLSPILAAPVLVLGLIWAMLFLVSYAETD